MNPIQSTGSLLLQEAFALSLLNSIWIGAIVVIICWIFRRIYGAKHQLNYFIAVSGLFVILLSCFINIIAIVWFNQGFSPLITRGEELLNLSQNAFWINRIWLLGTSLFLLKFFISHLYLRRLIHQSNVLTDDRWLEQYHRAKSYFLIKKQVVLLHCDQISSAFITGVLKPLIIIPTSWINHLTPKEVECILAHEFSHIMNKDHWINVFVQFMEIIFFFNPAVHILISHIKLDRELQADRIACGFAGEPMVYAKLILKVEENKTVLPALSIPFFRQKYQLRQRIESVLELPNTRKYNHSWYAIGFLLLGFFLTGNRQIPADLKSELNCTVRLEKIDQYRKSREEFMKSQEISKRMVYNDQKETKQKLRLKSPAKQNNNWEEQLELNTDQLIVFEYGEHKTIMKELEEAKEGLKNKTFRIIAKSRIEMDSSQFLQDGGTWISSKRIRSYSPAEARTIIIFQNEKKETRVFENDDTTPGLIQIGSSNIY